MLSLDCFKDFLTVKTGTVNRRFKCVGTISLCGSTLRHNFQLAKRKNKTWRLLEFKQINHKTQELHALCWSVCDRKKHNKPAGSITSCAETQEGRWERVACVVTDFSRAAQASSAPANEKGRTDVHLHWLAFSITEMQKGGGQNTGIS